MIKVNCSQCGKDIYRIKCRVQNSKMFFCSNSCQSKYKIGKVWNTGRTHIAKGKRISMNTEFKNGHAFWLNKKRPNMTGPKHPLWKGKNVGYQALHRWVYRHLGKPNKCIDCSGEYKVQWANKSHTYKRELIDWIPLCLWCHIKYDHPYRGTRKNYI